MRRRRLAVAIGTSIAVVALVCGLLGALAVNQLRSASGADGTAVAAAGPGSAGSGTQVSRSAAGPAVNQLGSSSGAAPAQPAVATLTPKRNPPLMAQGSEGEQVRGLQVRLAYLDLFDADVTGYFGTVTAAGVRAYQVSKGLEPTAEIYQELWNALAAETPEPTEEQLYPPPPAIEPPMVPPSSLDARCMTGRVLCTDKTDQVLRWVVNGRVLLEMDARFGRPSLPTREGQFSVYWKDRDHVSGLYEADMPYSMFFSGGQAVHYSSDFAETGYTSASHGCVNIRDYDGVAWLFDQVHVGDRVVIYWS